MPATFSSGATLDANGQIIPVVDVQPTPDPVESEPEAPTTPPDAAGEPADGEPEPAAEPADEEEAALSEPPRATRPFVARVIRENERLKRNTAAQAAQIEYLTRQLTQQPSQPSPPTQPEANVPSPTPSQRPQAQLYASHEEFIEALTDWKIDQRERTREAQFMAEREANARQTAQQQWARREAEGRDTYEDYDEVVSQLNLVETIAPIVADTFRESEQGAALLYYLGQHPKDMQHLNTLSPLAAARWLGQLEGRLAAPPPPPTRRPHTAPNGAGSPPAAPPMRPVGTGVAESVTGFRSGMPLLEYERMRTQQRQRTP